MDPIRLKPIELKETTIRINGITPLITHKWPEKAKKQIRDKKAGKKTRDREPCDPTAEYESSMHRLSDGSYGFPAHGFKAAMVNAAHKDLGIEKTLVRKSVFIHADDADLVRIDTPGPKMREDTVRVGMGSADLRYRAMFEQWGVNLRITWDADLLTIDALVNLLNRAGFGVGIGEWRPGSQGGGDFGRFEVVSNG